jgi:hypothetical protein
MCPTVTLRHECLAPQQPQLALALAHVVAHRRLGDRGVGELPQDPAMDAPRRVAPLARCTAILVKHLVDERLDRTQLRLGTLRVMLRGRQGARDRPAHNAPMNTK